MRIAIAALTMLSAAVLPAAAEQLAERLAPCFACHGEKGQSETPEVPSLGAQTAPYTLIQIYLFREKQRVFEPMNEATKGLSDDDLRDVADFIAKLPPPIPPADTADAARLDRGRALVEQYRCNICHRADLIGQENVPRLAAQREDYLVKTLRDYKSRARIGYDASMAEVLQPVGDAEIVDLAYFIARQR
ncbi:MAG TPA: c-type cytochrome [Stellaceae bacterium]